MTHETASIATESTMLARALSLLILLYACGGLPAAVRRAAPGPGQETSPIATANVHCTSTKGAFTIEMHPEWAPLGEPPSPPDLATLAVSLPPIPHFVSASSLLVLISRVCQRPARCPLNSVTGAGRFLELIAEGALDGTVIYRVVRNGKGGPEAVQFGFIKDPALRRKWRKSKSLTDDPQIFSKPNFHSGMISFAGGGPNTRGNDFFITFMTGNANGTPRVGLAAAAADDAAAAVWFIQKHEVER